MKEVINRVEIEYRELNNKIILLDSFLQKFLTDNPPKIRDVQSVLLETQIGVMKSYRHILLLRLDEFRNFKA